MDLRSELAGVANPTLVIVGDEDRATPPEQARELAAGIPDAQLVVMPRCAHAPQLQHPQSFLDTVGAFLGLHIA
jgi:pimeloyl-ACP methyl ester carboxylesterase